MVPTARTTSWAGCSGPRRRKVLMNSPAVEVIRWAQTQFPALLPGGDSRPLMVPPARPKPAAASRP